MDVITLALSKERGERLARRINAAFALGKGHFWNIDTDTETLYRKTVPTGALFNNLRKVGGKTIIWNQLNSLATASGFSGVELVESSGQSGTYLASEANGRIEFAAHSSALTVGHKYLTMAFVTASAVGAVKMTVAYGGTASNVTNATTSRELMASIDTCETLAAWTYPRFADTRASGWDNFIVENVQRFDLTTIYGAGNEPATVAAFRTDFPLDYYAATGNTLVNAGISEIVIKDDDDVATATIAISAGVRSQLEDYGASVWAAAYNRIEWREVGGRQRPYYVQSVASRDYEEGDESDTSVITDGTTTNYALDEAVVTDILGLLPVDNMVEVEAGGSITYKNANGDGFVIKVPVENDFLVTI